MSHNQREQPLLGKESGGPALMVESSSPSLAFLAAQDAPQPHPDPAVQVGERSAMTVLEVPQPAAQGPVQVRDDGRQTLSLGAPRLGTDRLFELLQALRAWPAIAALKGIAQKVKAARLRSVEDTRLRRVQSQSRRNRPRLHPLAQCRRPARAGDRAPWSEGSAGRWRRDARTKASHPGRSARKSALGPPAIPSPTICGSSALPRHVTYRQVEPRPHPFGPSPRGNSGLRHSLAGLPLHTDRIEFVILRTGRSPPAVLHPVSRRRSCSRLQVTLTWRGLSPLRPSALSGALAAAFRPTHSCQQDAGLKPASTRGELGFHTDS